MTGDESSVSEAAGLISKKWHPRIIQALLEDGPLRFSELRDRLGVSAKVLTDSLEDLTENGLVRRVEISQSPLRVEYELTSHGRDLRPVIEALEDWGERHLGEDSRSNILIVEGDPRLAVLQRDRLADDYDVEIAHDLSSAVAAIQEADLLLIDRRLPDGSADEVIRRAAAAESECGVILLTSVQPTLDIAELPIDAYIRQPTTGEELREAVAEVLSRREGDQGVREFLALQARRAVLERTYPLAMLEESERYRRLVARIEHLAGMVDTDSSRNDRTMPAAPSE